MKKLGYFYPALFLFIGQNTLAHSLYVFAQNDGKQVSGKSYYSDMTPAAETYLELYQQGKEQPVLTSKTDNKGEFHLPIKDNGIYKVVIEGEEGHRASVIADNIKPSTENGLSQDSLLLLRQDIAQLRDKIYWHDILGGLGYIIGIFGFFAWWKSKPRS